MIHRLKIIQPIMNRKLINKDDFLNVLRLLFDYFSKKYRKWGETDMPGLYALGIITVFQTLNVMTLYILSLIFALIKPGDINKWYFFFLSLLFLFINYLLIYRNRNYSPLKNDNKFSRRIHVITLIYAIGTFVFFLIPFIYRLYHL